MAPPQGGQRYSTGRKGDPIRLNFITLNNNKNHMRCKVCNVSVSNKVERLRDHVAKKCFSAPEPTRETSSVPIPPFSTSTTLILHLHL